MSHGATIFNVFVSPSTRAGSTVTRLLETQMFIFICTLWSIRSLSSQIVIPFMHQLPPPSPHASSVPLHPSETAWAARLVELRSQEAQNGEDHAAGEDRGAAVRQSHLRSRSGVAGGSGSEGVAGRARGSEHRVGEGEKAGAGDGESGETASR